MNKHTPGPWTVDIFAPLAGVPALDVYRVGARADSAPVARCHFEADADFIVRACNVHADLLAALEALLGETNVGTWDCLPVDLARAVIAKARGE